MTSGGGQLIESLDQLEAMYRGGIKTLDERRVGTEHEKFVVRTAQPGVVPYDGPDGICAVLTLLRDRFGHEPMMEGDNLIGLLRDGASVTLEPGGQFELSGAPFHSLLDTEAELATLWTKLPHRR